MIWRRLFPLIFAYVLIDGLIVNFTFPAKAPLLFKDFFIIFVALFFVLNEHPFFWLGALRRQLGSPAWYAAAGFMAVGVAEIFNPLSPGLLLGILGFKVIYFYWVLALMAFVYFDTFEKVVSFMKLMLVLSIPVNLFGLYQYIAGPDSLIAFYGPSIMRAIDIAAIEGYKPEDSFLRILGTFTATGPYANYLVVHNVFALSLFLSKFDKKKNLFYLACLLLGFVCLLAAGSRSAFAFMFLSLALMFLINRNVRPLMTTMIVVMICLFAGFQWLGAKVLDRFRSLEKIEMVHERTIYVTSHMFLDFLNKYPLGVGLGAGSTASKHLSTPQAATWQLIENYPAKLQFETGIVGLVLYYLFIFFLLAQWLGWLRLFPPETPLYIVVSMLTSYVFVMFGVAGVFFIIDSPPIPIFLWTIVGIVARLARQAEDDQSYYYSLSEPK